jgi:antitoxin VapB
MICKTLVSLEIARKTKDELAKFNINPVVTLVGADERIERFRHPTPTENVWKKNLLIAVCAKREGLIANLSRIVCVGKVPDELQRKTEAAAFVFAKLLSETKTGKTGAELYKIAADAYAEKDFTDEINKHHQGGATGYKTRDWVIHPKSGETVFQNQAFAWNPSITGTKAEETYLISETGEIEIFTATPNFPNISVEIGGREFISPGILSL